MYPPCNAVLNASPLPMTRAWWAALAALPLVVFALRALGFLPSVIDWDESLYILQAREWLRGGWPLVAVWDMHPIGGPAMFAMAMLLFGESIGAIRLLGVIAVSATGWALFFLLRAGGLPLAVGYAAALLYAGHSVLLGGMPVNTEILFAPFITAAMVVALPAALNPDRPPETWRVITMGLLVGWAMMIKPVVMPDGCLAFAVLVGGALLRRTLPVPRLMRLAAIYAGLCVAPTAFFGLVYLMMGELALYLDSTILAPFTYAQAGLALSRGVWRLASVAIYLLWLFLLAAGALVLLKRQPLVAIALAWFGSATLAITLPAQFFPHYFLVWLPSLSVLAALGAHALSRYLAPRRALLCLALITVAVSLDPWRNDSAPRIWSGHNLLEPDAPARIAEHIAEEMPPGETIFIANYQPIVYFLANAALPTRFAFPAHLTGVWNNLAGSDTDAEITRILETRPRFIVVDRTHWGAMRPAAARAITTALEGGYQIAYVFQDGRSTVELWRVRDPDPEND